MLVNAKSFCCVVRHACYGAICQSLFPWRHISWVGVVTSRDLSPDCWRFVGPWYDKKRLGRRHSITVISRVVSFSPSVQGGAENDAHEIDGPNVQAWNWRTWKCRTCFRCLNRPTWNRLRFSSALLELFTSPIPRMFMIKEWYGWPRPTVSESNGRKRKWIW